jgi:predicted DsbA family dithiol-disulfide isomerase
MPGTATVAIYADLSCPFAYVAHARWRRLAAEYAGRLNVQHCSLSLEYVNREPTPKAATLAELELLVSEEPGIAHGPWTRPESEWPVTIWPAFEAVKCAERQSLALADELAWRIRVGLFAESRCISLRHVLIELAAQAGLDRERFSTDFDSGVAKGLVLDEARRGWEQLAVDGSPTFVLPSGEQFPSPGLPGIEFDAESGRAKIVTPSACRGEGCLELYRGILSRALN